tara:strand:+ start:130 stop:246 length:117 start_codon:yes stop_codon:yes gene_type:complete
MLRSCWLSEAAGKACEVLHALPARRYAYNIGVAEGGVD